MGQLGPANPCSKAAAWAWYQRILGPGSARSEVALAAGPRRSVRGCPSRFKLEAELLSGASIQAPSERLESPHLCVNSLNPSSEASIQQTNDMSTASSTARMQQLDVCIPSVCTDLVVAAPSSYGAAAWDCGSALFDSFELVAMAKKLDNAHQLNAATMEKVFQPAADATAATNLVKRRLDGEEEKGIHRESYAVQLSADQLLSRQAVYDMFCRYDNPETPEGSLSEDLSLSTCEHMRKPKPAGMLPVAYQQRRRLNSLSRAFKQHIAQLVGRSRTSSSSARGQPDNKPRLHQFLSLPAQASAQPQSEAHPSPVDSMVYPHPASAHIIGDAASPRVGINMMGSPFRECPPPHKCAHAASPRISMRAKESPFRECPPSEGLGAKASSHRLRKQYSSDGVHHHYHHHYHHHHHHYLFQQHSDEGLVALPEPLLGADKSLLVAAAGLRMAKASSLQDYLLLNPKLEGALIDYKRKSVDTTASPIQSPSPLSLHS